MKLEKLYTRSQFDRILKEKFLSAGLGMVNSVGRECFELELKFGELREQPLTKEMFINPIVKPDIHNYKGSDCGVCGMDIYHESVAEWQKAEKKVIFMCDNPENVETIIIAAKTIGGYANAMNGELTLKNVTI